MRIIRAIYIFAMLTIFLFVSACVGNTSNSTSTDIQNFSISIGSSFNIVNISAGSATGCKLIQPNGICNVTMTYSGTGIYTGAVSLVGLNGYTSNVSSCANAISAPVNCTFIITNTSGNVSGAESVSFAFNGNNITESGGIFTVGGGL